MARQIRSLTGIIAILIVVSCGREQPVRKPATGPIQGGSLTASLRSEPGTFNRYAPNGAQAAPDAITRLTQATLVRIDRATGSAEPWLADHWTTSPDGRTLTFTLRDGITFSDGVPFTSADVLFSFRALYEKDANNEFISPLASAVMAQGTPLDVSAPDARTVVVKLAAPFAAGPGLLDSVWIYPQHQLQAALDAHAFAKAWDLKTPSGSMAGLGPFVLTEFAPNQRMTFTRNPHYWRKDAAGHALPYLDRLVVEFVKSQDTELLHLQAGTIDMMTQAGVRPSDISALRQMQKEDALQLEDPGVSVDPDVLWFNLTPEAEKRDAETKPYLHRLEFRQAISYAVDRDAIVSTLYLGSAVPIYGPVTPGNRTWYSDAAPKYPHDTARAKALLTGLGLADRNGDGMLEDAAGRPVRFSILAQGGHMRERVATQIQAQLKQVGIAVDVVALDPPALAERWGRGDYETIYHGFQASSFDPALNMDFWLSSGASHWWYPEQKSPATPWERQIDDLMQQQSATNVLADRQRLFADVQRIFGENIPAIYLIAPHVPVALSRRVGGAVPVVLEPKVLWQSDTLYSR